MRKNAQDPNSERLAKIMAQRGLCSRREAERLILAGMVKVNGAIINTIGEPVPAKAEIEIIGQGRLWLETKITVLMHKPVGIVSTMPEGTQVPAWQLLTKDRLHDDGDSNPDQQVIERILAKPWLLSVAGRLDKDSRGLLVMTTDGLLVKAITGGDTLTKRYQVVVDQPVTRAQLQRLNGPRQLDDKPLLPMQVDGVVGKRALTFILREGRKHQIRRVCLEEGLTVVDLLRDRIGDWALGSLPEGQWRIVTGKPKAESMGERPMRTDPEPVAAAVRRTNPTRPQPPAEPDFTVPSKPAAKGPRPAGSGKPRPEKGAVAKRKPKPGKKPAGGAVSTGRGLSFTKRKP